MKIDTAEFIRSASRRDQFPRDGLPEVAFVGRSNVGKSSLMNRLLQRRGLARTSNSPGRTRAVNLFLVNRRFYFVDLPGYGFARAPKSERRRWAELIGEYFEQSPGGEAAGGRLLIQLVDGKVGATQLDRQALDYFRDLRLEPLMVATKIDKVPRSKRVRSLRAIRQTLELPERGDLVAFSAVSGDGVKELWKGISVFLTDRQEKPQPVRVT